MGQLKPNATYIYEHVNGITYAREYGSTHRTIIGMSADAYNTITSITDEELWRNIREAAKSNEALQRALEHCKILYYLQKEDGDSKT